MTLEVYNTDNYVENLLQFECSVGMKIERRQLPLFVCSVACFQHTEFAFNQRSTCMQNSTGSMIRCFFSNTPVDCGFIAQKVIFKQFVLLNEWN